MNTSVVTQQDIEKGLRALGLREGDAVEVHSSLSAFGRVEGGASAIVDALMNVVTDQGALVMSAYLVSPPVPVSEEERARGIRWKLRLLPEGSDEPTAMGAVVEEFRRRPGVVCGHGIHRICAWGRDAERLKSGYRHLLEIDGWTLLLGVGIDRASRLHLAEDVSIPEKIRAYWKVPDEIWRDYDPKVWDIGYGGSPENAWAKVYAEADRQGLIRRRCIGLAECILFKARPVVNIYREWWRADPFGLFGVPKEE